MLKSIIRTLLQKFIDDIDSDNCNITMEQQSKIISVLSNIANPDQRMSKIQACDYLGVSRATFDNYVRDGTTMRRWYATMVANGTMVDWEDVI